MQVCLSVMELPTSYTAAGLMIPNDCEIETREGDIEGNREGGVDGLNAQRKYVLEDYVSIVSFQF